MVECLKCRAPLMPDHSVCFSDECVRARREFLDAHSCASGEQLAKDYEALVRFMMSKGWGKGIECLAVLMRASAEIARSVGLPREAFAEVARKSLDIACTE